MAQPQSAIRYAFVGWLIVYNKGKVGADMAMNLSIPVNDEELVHIYESATPEDREKIKALLALWLRQLKEDRKAALLAYMDTLSDRAQERGLTEAN